VDTPEDVRVKVLSHGIDAHIQNPFVVFQDDARALELGFKISHVAEPCPDQFIALENSQRCCCTLHRSQRQGLLLKEQIGTAQRLLEPSGFDRLENKINGLVSERFGCKQRIASDKNDRVISLKSPNDFQRGSVGKPDVEDGQCRFFLEQLTFEVAQRGDLRNDLPRGTKFADQLGHVRQLNRVVVCN